MLYHIIVRLRSDEVFYVKSVTNRIVFTKDISAAKIFKDENTPVNHMLYRVRCHYDNVSMCPVIFKIHI